MDRPGGLVANRVPPRQWRRAARSLSEESRGFLAFVFEGEGGGGGFPMVVGLLFVRLYGGLLLGFVFRRIPFCLWFISVAPMRGGSHFLCCCKESNQRKQLVRPAVTRSLAMLARRSWAA